VASRGRGDNDDDDEVDDNASVYVDAVENHAEEDSVSNAVQNRDSGGSDPAVVALPPAAAVVDGGDASALEDRSSSSDSGGDRSSGDSSSRSDDSRTTRDGDCSSSGGGGDSSSGDTSCRNDIRSSIGDSSDAAAAKPSVQALSPRSPVFQTWLSATGGRSRSSRILRASAGTAVSSSSSSNHSTTTTTTTTTTTSTPAAASDGNNTPTNSAAAPTAPVLPAAVTDAPLPPGLRSTLWKLLLGYLPGFQPACSDVRQQPDGSWGLGWAEAVEQKRAVCVKIMNGLLLLLQLHGWIACLPCPAVVGVGG
jgi:hypothetical protein